MILIHMENIAAEVITLLVKPLRGAEHALFSAWLRYDSPQ